MMTTNLRRELSLMAEMRVSALREKYFEVFGEENRSRNRVFLIKRIAWRLQANAEGDLSERARQRARELANDADLRTTMPSPVRPTISKESIKLPFAPRSESRLPLPGTLLTREYRGKRIRVCVLEDGFEYEGEVFRSLSAVAKKVTGSHWNGFQFFNLAGKGGAK